MAVKYLVTEKDGTAHLPVTGEDGKPDHHLMGAAWAELHGGYRSNKYEGEHREEAIKKLTALYHEEKMELPGHTITGKATLIARAIPFGTSGVPKSLVYLPVKTETVNSFTVDGDDATPIFVNPTRRSAVNLEAARRELVGKGKPPFFDYSHEGVFKRSDRKSGVPTRFWWDAKRGVMVDADWTEAAAKALVGKVPEWDAISPHCVMENGEAIGLFQNCGGLVNASALGRENRFQETADYQEMVAGNPDMIAQIDAALRDDESTNAAENPPSHKATAGKGERRMKELIAKLCAAFKISADNKSEPDLEKELIGAFDAEHGSVATLTARAGIVQPVITALGYAEKDEPKAETLTARAGLLPAVLVGLGFAKDANPKPEELTAKIVELGKPGEVRRLR